MASKFWGKNLLAWSFVSLAVFTTSTARTAVYDCNFRPWIGSKLGVCEQKCLDLPGGDHRCYCSRGYLLLDDEISCFRDDRCPSRCAFGCVKDGDDIKCFCADGLKSTKGESGCEDINECVEGKGDCPEGKRCRNIYGSYYCVKENGEWQTVV